MAKEKRYFVTANISVKLAEGVPAAIVDGKTIQNSIHPVRVKLERLTGGAVGYSIADIRKLAKFENMPSRVDALKDEQIEAILDAMTMDATKAVWVENDYVRLTRGPDAAQDNEKLSTLASERKKLSEENENLKKQIAELQKRK
jgi:hypothetical protein